MIIYFKSIFFLGGIVTLFLGLFIFLKNRKEIIAKTYFGMSMGCAVWSLGFFMLVSSTSLEMANFWRWFMESGSIFIAAFWLHFIAVFTGVDKEKDFQIKVVYLVGFFLWLLNLSDLFGSRLFAKDIVQKAIFNYYPTAAIGYLLYLIFFFIVVTYSLFILFQNQKKQSGSMLQQNRYLIVSAVLGFGGGGMTFFLTFDIPVIPYGVIFFSLYPVAIAYTVTKHNLFNIKIIATQLLVASISIFIFVRTVIADSIQEQVIDFALFLAITISGIFLVKSVKKEVEQREKIQKLAIDLEKANARLKEVDQLKSEFVSLATHQIRGPLAAIKGYASLIMEGDYGEVSPVLWEPVDTIFRSSQSLAVIVDDFLNVSRIEQGRMKYDIENFDLCALVNEVVGESRKVIEKRGLTVDSTCPSELIQVRGDKGKIKQVIGNILDNAIKYTPKGSIHLALASDRNSHKALIKIKDTGVGIRPETIPHLFKKFSRAEDASKVNILGTGLGLYVAREMIEAQGGRIWVESEGEGKGSTFFVELSVV